LTDAALAILAARAVDFTGFWRDLAAAADGDQRPLRSRFLGPVPELDGWLHRWLALGPDPDLLRRTNPVYIPRNHLVDEALAAAVDGDVAPFTHLLGLLRAPFTERAGHQNRRFARPAPAGSPGHLTYCGT
ncbi:MAG: hypothetical protein B7X41_08730, partial [Microbacterium sp. 14-71-5]